MLKERKDGQRPWVKPELTVLVRSQAEESVLGNCQRTTAMSGRGGGCTSSGCYSASNNPTS